MARFWYAYNGIGDPYLPSSYNIILSRPPQPPPKPTCVNGTRVCAIYTPLGGINPTTPLSSNIRLYIANFFLTTVAQPDSSSGTKKYVYGRP